MNPYESTDLATAEPEPLQTWELQRVGVYSAFRVLGFLYAGLAAFFGVLYGVIIAIISMFAAVNGEPKALLGMLGAVVFAVFLPIFYGFIGGLAGAFMAFLYNVISGQMGGLELSFAKPDN